MTTNRSRPSDRAISRQKFLRGAVGVLAGGAVFATTRAAADPGAGWGALASSISGSVVLPANGAQFATSKQARADRKIDESPGVSVCGTQPGLPADEHLNRRRGRKIEPDDLAVGGGESAERRRPATRSPPRING
jgi:hypothetical protein